MSPSSRARSPGRGEECGAALRDARFGADERSARTVRPQHLPLGADEVRSAWGHGGEAVGYSTWARASKDGSHVVFLGATTGYYASDLFKDAFQKAVYSLYCRS